MLKIRVRGEEIFVIQNFSHLSFFEYLKPDLKKKIFFLICVLFLNTFLQKRYMIKSLIGFWNKIFSFFSLSFYLIQILLRFGETNIVILVTFILVLPIHSAVHLLDTIHLSIP